LTLLEGSRERERKREKTREREREREREKELTIRHGKSEYEFATLPILRLYL